MHFIAQRFKEKVKKKNMTPNQLFTTFTALLAQINLEIIHTN